MYFDEWLILSDSRQKCSTHIQFLFHLANQLGFIPNQAKFELLPSQPFSFLRLDFDTVAFTVWPITARLNKLSATLTSLQVLPSASARDLTFLQGQIESLFPLFPLGRLHKWQFQRGSRDRWSKALLGWDDLIILGPRFQASTQQLANFSWLAKEVPISLPPHKAELYTEEFCHGRVGHVEFLCASGT